MTISANANEDGSVTLKDSDGATLTMHDYDLPTILGAAAHADVKHLAHPIAAMISRGRVAVDHAWCWLTAVKSTADGLAVDALATIEEKEKALFEAQEALNKGLNEAMPAAQAALGVKPAAEVAPADSTIAALTDASAAPAPAAEPITE